MKKGLFFCIIGVDGSGKTTLANSVIESTSSYLDLSYKYCGWRQFDSFLFRPIVKILKYFTPVKKTSHTDSNSEQTLKNTHKHIFKTFLLLDYYLVTLTRIIIPRICQKNIICDRYLYDVLINSGLDLHETHEEIIDSIQKWRKYFPMPDLIFLIDVPINVAFSRKDDIPHEEYLFFHRELFMKVSTFFDIVLLDGTQSPQFLLNSITYKIKENLGDIYE